MGTFEQYFAEEALEVAPALRVPAKEIANVGGVEAAEAIGSVGRGLTEASAVLFKWYEREGNSEYDTLRGLYASEIGSFERTPFKDTTAIDAGFKKLEADLAKLPSANDLKNKSGLKKYKAFMELNKAGREKIVGEKSIRMVERNIQSALFAALSKVSQQPDRDKAMAELNLLIQGGLDDGSIKTSTQAFAIKDRFTKDWEVADLNRRSQTIIRPDGEVDWTETVNWLNQPQNTEGTDPDVLKSLKSNAKTQKDAQDGRDKEKLEAQQEIDRGNIYELINNNSEDAISTINGSSLEEKEKQSLRESIGKDIDLNYPEYDKVVDIIDGVALGTHTKEQADQAIRDGVGKHYNSAIAISLRSKLSEKSKAGSPTRRPAHTRGLTTIEEVFDIQIESQQFGPEDFEAESALILKKNRAKNDFDAWALEEDRTDEEIEKKVELLTKPIKEEIVGNWLSRWWRFITPKGIMEEQFRRAETFKHIAVNPDTGERMGSNDGVKWQPIP